MSCSAIRCDIRDLILYEDKDIVVVNKPAGLAVQSADATQMDLESLLKNYCHSSYIGIVHRLDQPVEGLLVCARTRAAAGSLGKQLQSGECRKYYFAAVCRLPYDENLRMTGQEWLCCLEEGRDYRLEDSLIRDGRKNMSFVVPPDTPGAKTARLSFRVIVSEPDRAVLKVWLHTGRHHQIRVQLSHAGWPLSGDRKYGGEETAVSDGLGLCAAGLSFLHPGNRRKMEFRILPKNPCFEWALEGGRTLL